MGKTNTLEVVAAIHKRIREQSATYEPGAMLEEWSNELGHLNSAYNQVYCARNLVGNAPQLPNTWLAIVAGWTVGIVQKMLFWYTPQIRQFHLATTAVLNRICSLEERKYRSFLSMAGRIDNIEKELRLLKTAQAAAAPRTEADTAPLAAERATYVRGALDPRDFYFELQRRFQSNTQADAERRETYQSVIGNLDPKIPAGEWLDIGCGRGQWLRLASDRGH